MVRQIATLTELAQRGFAQLGSVNVLLDELTELGVPNLTDVLAEIGRVGDPDEALRQLVVLARIDAPKLSEVLSDHTRRLALLQVLGASVGLAEFFARHPEELEYFAGSSVGLPTHEQLSVSLLDVVGDVDGIARSNDEDLWSVLRVRYRRWLAQIAAYDLASPDPRLVFEKVATALSDAASAVIHAALSVARRHACDGYECTPIDENDLMGTRLSIIGMGKAGAAELNYVSDVDVIFVAEGDESHNVDNARAVTVATTLAKLTMRIVNEMAIEPPLWEIDPNLRPEGKQGALVRTLESHLAYYERWAKSWEFQALLKARPLAGDRELGDRYVDAISPLVWSSAARTDFVESVQRMRQRVTDHIPADELHYQIKLGPGGLRDIEFTVQLLQLVHGLAADGIRQRATLPALRALADEGFIGRVEAAEFAADYRLLRVLEHRLQLAQLRRTHLMPRDEDALRVLARSSRLASTATGLTTLWESTKHEIRVLHERLFYRPLLAAVAGLPEEELVLSTAQAEARLEAIGFRDARGALSHIAALTQGVSRRATIQRHLMPVMLRWFAEGADPDYGLLAFRRLSETMGTTHWFLRTLRDASGVAERLTRALSGSRYIGELIDRIPEAVAWLEDDADLRPRDSTTLYDEVSAIVARHDTSDAASRAIRMLRRRELLRLALGSTLGVIGLAELGAGLTSVMETTIEGIIRATRKRDETLRTFEFAVIAMGRFGGSELGFGSDADVMYVYRADPEHTTDAQTAAGRIVTELKRLTEDSSFPLDLDPDLRPEGKNGSLVRSLDSYRAYYQRWSATWEAQALLRARGIAGDTALIRDFEAVADELRYPAKLSDGAEREIKRIKARVENERLPQGVDPQRHVKLGPGTISDVEWLVQLLQMQHAHEFVQLQTTSTLDALGYTEQLNLVSAEDSEALREAWVFASRLRSAMTLWLDKTTDVLPSDRHALEGIARVLEYEAGSASELEQDYSRITRRARRVFERLFYGEPDRRPINRLP